MGRAAVAARDLVPEAVARRSVSVRELPSAALLGAVLAATVAVAAAAAEAAVEPTLACTLFQSGSFCGCRLNVLRRRNGRVPAAGAAAAGAGAEMESCAALRSLLVLNGPSLFTWPPSAGNDLRPPATELADMPLSAPALAASATGAFAAATTGSAGRAGFAPAAASRSRPSVASASRLCAAAERDAAERRASQLSKETDAAEPSKDRLSPSAELMHVGAAAEAAHGRAASAEDACTATARAAPAMERALATVTARVATEREATVEDALVKAEEALVEEALVDGSRWRSGAAAAWLGGLRSRATRGGGSGRPLIATRSATCLRICARIPATIDGPSPPPAAVLAAMPPPRRALTPPSAGAPPPDAPTSSCSSARTSASWRTRSSAGRDESTRRARQPF